VIRFLRRWGPALLWTAILFFASSQPTLPVELRHGTDKLAHFAAYTVLGMLLARGQVDARISPFWPLLIGSAIGALDELYQGTVPGRNPSVGDWVADTLGVAAGVALVHVWRRMSSVRSVRAPINRTDSP
jgi:VanZ family protein